MIQQDDITALIAQTARLVDEHSENRDAVASGGQLIVTLLQARDLAWTLNYSITKESK